MLISLTNDARHGNWLYFQVCVGFPCDIRLVAPQGMRAFCPLPTWLVLLPGCKTKIKLPACWTWISSFW